MSQATEDLTKASARISRNVTIKNGSSISSVIDLTSTSLLGFIMPSDWTTAALSIGVSNDGVTFYPAYDAYGSQTGYIASPVLSAAYAVDLSALLPWRYVRLRSGTQASPVNQLADRTFAIITRGLA